MGKKKRQQQHGDTTDAGAANASEKEAPPPKEAKKVAAANKVPLEQESSCEKTPPPQPPKRVKSKDKSKERAAAEAKDDKDGGKEDKEAEEDKENKEDKPKSKAKKTANVDVSSEDDGVKAAAVQPPPATEAQKQHDGAGASEAPPRSAAKKGTWPAKDELTVAQQLLDDLKAGSDFHDKPKGDIYWEELWQSLKGKLSSDYTKEQIYDKHRRMKIKFDKYESAKPGARKRTHAEDTLHAVFKQLWGRDIPTEATAENSNGDVEMVHAKKGGEDRLADDLKAAAMKCGDGGGGGGGSGSLDPVLTIAASVFHSVMASHKLGSEYMKAGSRETRKRSLEDQISEYSSMRRRLKLAMDYCEIEEDLLAKKLSSI